MAKVKFVSETKYKHVTRPAHTVFTVDDSDLESLRASGAIVVEASVEPVVSTSAVSLEEIEGVEQEALEPVVVEEAATVEAATDVNLDVMTVAELRAYAMSNGISLGGATKKDVVREIIEEALAKQ